MRGNCSNVLYVGRESVHTNKPELLSHLLLTLGELPYYSLLPSRKSAPWTKDTAPDVFKDVDGVTWYKSYGMDNVEGIHYWGFRKNTDNYFLPMDKVFRLLKQQGGEPCGVWEETKTI